MAGLLDFFQGASNAASSNISAPVDGLAWLLKKAGIDIEKPVGGSDWMESKGLTRKPENKWAGLLGESVGGLAPIIAAAKAPQIARGLLQGADNLAAPRTLSQQAGMIKTPFGQIPETADDVKKLGDKFGRLLDDAGVKYSYQKSGLSPARYYEFNQPANVTHTADDIAKYGAESYKVRISDHKNVHGASFSVDPHTGDTFEQMLSAVRDLGVPIADKVKPKNTTPDKIYKIAGELMGLGDKSVYSAVKRQGGTIGSARPLEEEIWGIRNLSREELNSTHLKRLKEIQERGY